MLTISVSSLINKNLYSYCNNNPVRYYDEKGLFPLPVGQMVIGAVTNYVISAVSALATGQEFTLLDGVVALGTGLISPLKYNWVNSAVIIANGVSGVVSSLMSGDSIGVALLSGGISIASSFGMIGVIEELGGFEIKERLIKNVTETIFSAGTNLIASTTTRIVDEVINSPNTSNQTSKYMGLKETIVGGNRVVRSAYGGTARYVV